MEIPKLFCVFHFLKLSVLNYKCLNHLWIQHKNFYWQKEFREIIFFSDRKVKYFIYIVCSSVWQLGTVKFFLWGLFLLFWFWKYDFHFIMFQWICLTIVSPLRKEIEEVNAGLRRIGSEETEIGGQDPCPVHEQIFASQNYPLFWNFNHIHSE